MPTATPSSAGSVAPFLQNVLRPLSPTLRIAVNLGDLDAVFQPVNTVLGKKQRLQALGFYYEVISAATGNTVTEAYTNCLSAWRSQREGSLGAKFANDAAVEADMQTQIRNFVLEGGALPAAGGRVRVKLPGALTFNNANDLGAGGVANGNPLPSVRFNDEGSMWAGNTALGKIPIIAKVEELINGTWSVSPNRSVHFQLIPPFYDAAGSELNQVNALRNTSEQGTAAASNIVAGVGPRVFITNAIGFNFSAADPQRYNCHSGRGGKRGLAVSGNILDTVPGTVYAGLTPVQASSHANAVRVDTNAKGEAGILLLPSRMGGDVYRLRIYVDPIGIRRSDGTGASAVVFETGRFEVTKHLVWSRFLAKPMPVLPAVNTAKGVQARLSILGYDVGGIDGKFWGRSQSALRAFQANNAPLPTDGNHNDAPTQAALNAAVTAFFTTCGQNLGAMNFGSVAAQFAQMNCVMDVTPAQAMAPMKAADYKAAIHWARAQAHANQAAFGLSQVYNVNAMIEDTFDTPHLFVLRHPAYYNRTRGAGVPAASPGGPPANYASYFADAQSLIYGTNGLLELFLRFFTGNASATNAPTANLTRYSTPGLTAVRALSASVLMFQAAQPGQVQPPASNALTGASGMATKERSCAVFYGATIYANWPYQGDGLTKNTMHEMGHTLYLRHHRTVAGGNHANASFPEDHDKADRCLMGYLFCEGQYCGKCHLKIRGWDISQMPA